MPYIRKRQNDSGMALGTVLLILLVGTCVGAIALEKSRMGSRFASNNTRTIDLDNAAKEGLQLGILTAKDLFQLTGTLSPLVGTSLTSTQGQGAPMVTLSWLAKGNPANNTFYVISEAINGKTGARAKYKTLTHLVQSTPPPSVAGAIFYGSFEINDYVNVMAIRRGTGCAGTPAIMSYGGLACNNGMGHTAGKIWADGGDIVLKETDDCAHEPLQTAVPGSGHLIENAAITKPSTPPCDIAGYAQSADFVLTTGGKVLVGGVDQTATYKRAGPWCDLGWGTGPFYYDNSRQIWTVCNLMMANLNNKTVYSEGSLDFIQTLGSINGDGDLANDIPQNTTWVANLDINVSDDGYATAPNSAFHYNNNDPKKGVFYAGRDFSFGFGDLMQASSVIGNICANDDVTIYGGKDGPKSYYTGSMEVDPPVFQRNIGDGTSYGAYDASQGISVPVFQGHIVAGDINNDWNGPAVGAKRRSKIDFGGMVWISDCDQFPDPTGTGSGGGGAPQARVYALSRVE